MKGRGRQKHGIALQEPKTKPGGEVPREQWIEEVCAGFVAPSARNKEYYRVILEKLWPPGHGIPGPTVTELEVREAINAFRESKYGEGHYLDVFRRFRELQGEEGVVGIARQGKTFQLVSLAVQAKKEPREKLSDGDWAKVLQAHGKRCAVCGRSEPEVRFQQDHKVPRDRQGGNEITNWQPLCDECNNFKSTACRGCSLDCHRCPWAFPEKFAPLKIEPENLELLRKRALEMQKKPEALLNDLLFQILGR